MAEDNLNPADFIPADALQVPGPLLISDSAINVWNTATDTAQYRIENRITVPPIPVQTTLEDKCWVTLMALRREEELQEKMRNLENAWRELTEVKKVLGIVN
ncbi:uncharacterized protein EDB93DRAFT_1250881 [Suillus bovinus]|uniref:uncharacterized protein n=1 Tax=Suillus bovinus TaxID=48563 RepID=UPI001B8658EF|nr:uncharacterized protein EDB93DRAFT_1250881 [Suillus bovinus]KAG2146600.1 hypothetical protein EDB93DRAFT_1250881 [Suillus bovinus]